MKRFLVPLMLMLALLAPSAVSAHDVGTQFLVTPSCSTHRVTVDGSFTNFSDGHYIHLVVIIRGVTHIRNITPATSDGSFSRTFSFGGFGSFPVSVSAQARFPNGDAEGPEVTAESRFSCDAPRADIYHARITPACGDPWHRAILDNRLGLHARTFKFWFVKFSDRQLHSLRIVVPKGTLVRTRLVHVLGLTKMWVSSGGKVIATRTSPKPGYYGSCRDHVVGMA